jgi:hypothetical protein
MTNQEYDNLKLGDVIYYSLDFRSNLNMHKGVIIEEFGDLSVQWNGNKAEVCRLERYENGMIETSPLVAFVRAMEIYRY